MELNTLGRHILIEFYECDSKVLKDTKLIEQYMRKSAEIAGCTIVESVFHEFNPYGVSGAVIVQESHLTIHTWPEHNYAAVDVFTCGGEVNPWKACEFLEEKLVAKKSESTEIPRGVLEKMQQIKEDHER